jgi:D-alanine transaminase
MMLYQDRIVSEKEVHIHYEDRGYQFGDGVYEVCRVYGGQIFELDAHLERLERSAKEIRMSLPLELSKLSELLKELITREGVVEGTIYMQVTRGSSPRSHPIPKESSPILTAYAKSAPRPSQAIEHGVKAITTADIRWLRCDIKSLNLLGSVLCKQEAVDREVFESILHRDGIVTEGSSSNVMIIEKGTLVTHPANNLILNGITRIVVLELAQKLELPIREEAFSLERLHAADEVFLTGTNTEVAPVIQIDDQLVAGGKPGPIARKLQQALENKIHSCVVQN